MLQEKEQWNILIYPKVISFSFHQPEKWNKFSKGHQILNTEEEKDPYLSCSCNHH